MLVHGVADKQDSPGAIMICHHGFLEPSAGAQYFDRCVDLEESTQAVGHVVMVEANLFIWTENKTCAPLPAVAAKSIGKSEEHTSALQSLMRISYAVFCMKKKTKK